MLNRGNSDLLSAIPANGIAGHLHIRLCHLCLNLNESEAEIMHCERCQRPLIFDLEQMLNEEQGDDMATSWGPYDDSSEGAFELVTEELSDDDLPSDEEFDVSLGDYRRKFIHRLAGLSVLW